MSLTLRPPALSPERYLRCRERTRMLFDRIAPDAFEARPIPLRHPFIFYEGHIPAFSYFTFVEKALGGTVFFGAKFSGAVVWFIEAQFSSGTIYFQAAEFSGGEVIFNFAEFSGAAVTFAAEFSGSTVDFYHARFSGGTVSFSDAEFSGGAVDFSQVSYWSTPPEFSWTDSPPPGVQLPPGAA